MTSNEDRAIGFDPKCTPGISRFRRYKAESRHDGTLHNHR